MKIVKRAAEFPHKVAELLKKYPILKKYTQNHQLCILENLIEIDVMQNGNSFAADSRLILKFNEVEKVDEDAIYMGVWDSPECKDPNAFTEEKFALKVLDQDGNKLHVNWKESEGVKKRFNVRFGKSLNIGETIYLKATMFLPDFYNVRPPKKKEYFDLDITDPTQFVTVKIKFPEGLTITRKSFEYGDGSKCLPPDKKVIVKKDKLDNRHIIIYQYIWPEIDKIYYIYWNWKRLKTKDY